MTPPVIALTPEPPYYATIFTPQCTEGAHGYGGMAGRMVELASQQPGFLGVESVRYGSGSGITVSYWTTLEAIQAWRENLDHQGAKSTGKVSGADCQLRISRVERAYGKESQAHLG